NPWYCPSRDRKGAEVWKLPPLPYGRGSVLSASPKRRKVGGPRQRGIFLAGTTDYRLDFSRSRCRETLSSDGPGLLGTGLVHADGPVVARKSRIGTVIGVARFQQLVPLLGEHANLRVEAGLLFRCILRPSRQRLVVVEFRVRRPDDQVPAFPQSQAIIDVVESQHETLIQPAHLLEGVARRHETGSCHGTQILHREQPRHVARVSALQEQAAMAGDPPEAYHHAAMLDDTVGVVQFGTDGSHVATESVLQETLQPIFVDDLHVVIQKEEDFASGLPNPEIDRRRIIERLVPGNYPNFRPLLRLGVISERPWVLAVIFYYNYLVILVSRSGDGIETAAQNLRVVLARDDDRNERATREMVGNPIGAQAASGLDLSIDAATSQVFAESLLGCLESVHLGLNPTRHRLRMAAPVVEYLGDMHDLASLLGGAQDQVIVLRTVEARAKPSDLIHEPSPEHRHMGDVIDAPQRIGRPAGLKVGAEALVAANPDLVLIAVKEIGVGVTVDGAGNFKESEGGERVIVIEESEEIARGQRHRLVRVAHNALIFREEGHFDA